MKNKISFLNNLNKSRTSIPGVVSGPGQVQGQGHTPIELITKTNNQIKLIPCDGSDEESKLETEGFFCSKCYDNITKETNISSNTDEDFHGFDLNPDMDEENCFYCLNKMKHIPATCIYNGQPSCYECVLSKKNSKIVEATENLINLNSISKLLNDNNSHKRKSINLYTDTTPNFKDRNEISLNYSSNIVKSLQFNSEFKNKNIVEERAFTDRNIFISKNEKISSADEEQINPIFTEYTHEEMDNKIMFLTSPKSSIDFKFKKDNIIQNKIEKITKSIENIFNMSNVNINLPIVFKGSYKDKNTQWINIFNENNGTFLILFFDDKKEFIFGFTYLINFQKNAGKFFRKSPIIKEESPLKINSQLKDNVNLKCVFFEKIYENISITKEFLLIENIFKFNLSNYSFTTHNEKLLKFLSITKIKSNLYTNVKHLEIYDMC